MIEVGRANHSVHNPGMFMISVSLVSEQHRRDMTMKRYHMTFLHMALLFVGLAGMASAQTADEIVEKHLEAMGGREALEKLRTRKITGRVSVSNVSGEFSGTIETYAKAPNKSRSFMKLDLSATGMDDLVVDQRFNGTSGFVSNSLQGDSEITGRQLENLRNTVFPSALLSYKDLGFKIEVLPQEKLGDKDSIVLLITPKAGTSIRVYLDARNYFPIRMIAKGDSPQLGGEFEQITDYSDYRTVDGVKAPFQLKATNIAQLITTRVEMVEYNITIDDSLFDRPVSKK